MVTGNYFANAQSAANTPQISATTRTQLHTMLKITHDEVRKSYYDPQYHGVNLDSTFATYDSRLNSVQTLNQGFAVIAAYLGQLHDSHTYFVPPLRVDESEIGFRYEMFGDNCFVTAVDPKSDAAKKLHPGDQILTFDGFKLERSTFTDLSYYFGALATTRSTTLSIKSPDGATNKVTVANDYIVRPTTLDAGMDLGGMQRYNINRQAQKVGDADKPRFYKTGDVVVWKLPAFDRTADRIDQLFDQNVSEHSALILDLRGNLGGATETEQAMLAHLIDHEVTIDTRIARKPQKPETVKPAHHIFNGKLIVLVDHGSASASEIFARVIQLEHRGTVIGDKTAGAVMEAVQHDFPSGAAPFELSITFADLKMSDGGGLEKVGVTPDLMILPTAEDLAQDRDPVLQRAGKELGVDFDHEAVQRAFPIFWFPMQQW